MDARRGMLTGLTSTSRATARPLNSGSTSSSGSPSLLPIECSKSSFSIRAWRLMSLRLDEAHYERVLDCVGYLLQLSTLETTPPTALLIQSPRKRRVPQ